MESGGIELLRKGNENGAGPSDGEKDINEVFISFGGDDFELGEKKTQSDNEANSS